MKLGYSDFAQHMVSLSVINVCNGITHFSIQSTHIQKLIMVNWHTLKKSVNQIKILYLFVRRVERTIQGVVQILMTHPWENRRAQRRVENKNNQSVGCADLEDYHPLEIGTILRIFSSQKNATSAQQQKTKTGTKIAESAKRGKIAAFFMESARCWSI